MSYLGINPADSAVINKREYIATAGQTTFPCLYDEYVEVYLNGSRLAADDFTATDGMNVVLTLAAEADDVIVCSGYENARFDNSVSTTGTDTISGVKTFTAQPVGIVKASVGLSNVDNTSDADKPISTATQTALNLKANQATTYTKAETDTAIANLVDSAPTALNTLNELASALGDDVNFSTTVANNIGTVSSNLSSHASNTSNPHSVTKTQVGLGNVTNDAQVKTVTSTDNAVVRFDGTTGQVQNSNVVIDDSGTVIATTFSGELSGNATTATTASSCSGNSATATSATYATSAGTATTVTNVPAATSTTFGGVKVSLSGSTLTITTT